MVAVPAENRRRPGAPGRPGRGRWWAPAVAWMAFALSGCAGNVPGGAAGSTPAGVVDDVIAPWMTIDGARLAAAPDATGTPSLQAAPLVFRRFLHPAAAALYGNDIYIVDSGAGVAYRFDITMNAMTPVKGVPAQPTTRVLVGGDYSLFVLDARNRRVLRYARNGALLAIYADDLNLARPVDIAFDETRNVLLVADGVYNHLVAFHPLGRASYAVPLRASERDRVHSVGGVAAGADAWYVSDPACRCIVRAAPDGAVLATFGHQQIGMPGALAVDRYGRVYVADRLDNSLKLFVGDRLVRTIAAPALGVRQVSDLRIAGESLVIADALGLRAVLLRLTRPRPAGTPGSP